ncbi:periplasmic heavy metal sensor [candidate division KSB1 bacterium]|nr:periplasmic heavy metal sensor [candidate division KSB1 bacterium]RQW04761.1 MAG: periplasmic heavy metal sensor [candidate division KSB1 bacterium]
MDVFSRKHWMVIALVLLVLLNVATLSFMWMRMQFAAPSRDRPENQERLVHFLKKELQLNDKQLTAFLEQRRDHQIESQRIRDEIHFLKEEMLNKPFHDQPGTLKVNNLINAIAEKQRAMERLTSAHFAGLKKICGDQQQERLQNCCKIFSAGNRHQNTRLAVDLYNKRWTSVSADHGKNLKRLSKLSHPIKLNQNMAF